MPVTRKFTLMFYFASDNAMASTVISQLKALKAAGYHHEVNVIAYFEPQIPGTPTDIFDVNAIYKLENAEPKIGFTANDPFVRDLMDDKLWGDELSRDGKTSIRDLLKQSVDQSLKALKREVVFDLPKPPPLNQASQGAAGSQSSPTDSNGKPDGPEKSLAAFLHLCSVSYPAEHYMLFLLGHGLVVGDDVFLFSEQAAKHSVTLRELGNVLEHFKNTDISKSDIPNADFDLVSFHSCSMSSLEVASELQGVAKYMLASQGPAFVGSWPYTQIVIRVLNDVKDSLKDLNHPEKVLKPIDVKEMVKKIFSYVLHNSTDYILAGYSFDLCLCDLRNDKIAAVQEAIAALSNDLIKGLNDPLVRNCILLAHWNSQSYWQETYTDLYDFCFCLSRYCDELHNAAGNMNEIQTTSTLLRKLLMKESRADSDKFVVLAEYAGPSAQYSHGLSVFFPWAAPAKGRPIMKEYAAYKFAASDWLDFLKAYFAQTIRNTRKDEADPLEPTRQPTPKEELFEDMATLMFNADGPMSGAGTLDGLPKDKRDPNDPTGDSCNCGSIKNYPRDTRKRIDRQRGPADPLLPVGDAFFNV